LAALVVAAWVALPGGIFVGVSLVPLFFLLIARFWRCERATVRWRSRRLGDLVIEVSSPSGEGGAAKREKEEKNEKQKDAPKSSPKAIARVSDFDAFEKTETKASAKASAWSAPQAKALLCPMCGSPMVKRDAHKGGQFWGCTKWPLCDATRQFSDPNTWNVGPKNRARRSRIEFRGTAGVGLE
jgi:ssDNA-binding Zn-finger/Zn-ribbon topoisomerase 1